jgi:hypothetical protein
VNVFSNRRTAIRTVLLVLTSSQLTGCEVIVLLLNNGKPLNLEQLVRTWWNLRQNNQTFLNHSITSTVVIYGVPWVREGIADQLLLQRCCAVASFEVP